MKNSITIITLIFFIAFNVKTYSQTDSLGLAGDNLDLAAVLGIFKESANLEEFEKKLNAADSKINNLDLNNDGKVDYLRVMDNVKDGAHSIVIRDPVSKSESQDVAVIEVEKKGDKTAHVQIVGDETLYGKNYIIEPKEGTKENISSGGKIKNYDDDVYNGPGDYAGTMNIINVWGWPSVSYMYSPGYVVWVSPWYWGYYPPWYYPWSPYGWYPYWNNIHHYNYYHYGRRSNVYHNPRAHKMYYGQRATSGYVEKTVPVYNRRVQPQPGPGGDRTISQPRMNRSQPNQNQIPRIQNQQPGIWQQRNDNGPPTKTNPNVQPVRNPGGQPNQTSPAIRQGGRNQGSWPNMNRGGGGGGGQGGGGSWGRRR